MKRQSQIFLFILILLTTVNLTFASIVDHSFHPFVTSTNLTVVNAFAVQPDGKYLVGGDFDLAGGYIRRTVARFNPDGTLDHTFQSPVLSGWVNSIALQPDGKILVGGDIEVVVNGVFYENFLRFNPDGSLDPTFLIGPNPSEVKSIFLQPDGKILIVGSFSDDTPGNKRILRLNADRTRDTTFTPTTASGEIKTVVLLPDGKMLVGGIFSQINSVNQPWLARLNHDGTVDPSFTLNVQGQVWVLKLLPDNRILVGGTFSFIINKVRQNAIIRLNPDLTLDESFYFDNGNQSGTGNQVKVIERQPDGKLIVGGYFEQFSGGPNRSIHRLDENGTVDASFAGFSDTVIYAIKTLPGGQTLVGGGRWMNFNTRRHVFYRLDSNGAIEPNFPASVGDPSAVDAIAALPNGKVYIGGDFSDINGREQYRLARLNADGLLDRTFRPAWINDDISAVAAQLDGKVIIGGRFGAVGGVPRGRLARLNYDGSLDTTFDVGAGADDYINDIAVQADGKIIIGGGFDNYDNVPRTSIARVNPDGSLDTTFNVGSTGPSNSVAEIIPLADGKTLVGGYFGYINNIRVGNIARVNADGSLDTSFNQGGSGANPPVSGLNLVSAIARQTDGKIVVGGVFSGFNGGTQANLVRLNANGTLDPTFTVSIDQVSHLEVQPDGKILVGGSFQTVNGVSRNGFARLEANGSLDISFDIGTGADNSVYEFARLPNGNIVAAGAFLKFDGRDHPGIALLRVSNAPLGKTPFDFDGDAKTDVSIFRPSVGEWWINRSSTFQTVAAQFGLSTDNPTPADFTGDGKADIAFFRPESGEWFILRSEDGSFFSFPFGQTGDVPAPSDYDGDGKADPAVFRPGSGEWFILRSTGGVGILAFGTSGDVPVPADYDGDGNSDIAIWRVADGSWWYLRSSDLQYRVYRFGISTDKPVQGDYTGDGKADIAIFRPGSGEWYVQRSEDNSFYSVPFGTNGDQPTPGDYDGDERFDTAVFRPNGSTWYVNRSTTGLMIQNFGAIGDQPVPASFVP